MDENDQLRFGFDLFDPTKIVPEDIVPFTPLGKLTLNRNPRNYFAETEQIMVIYYVPHYLWYQTNTVQVSSRSYREGYRFYGRSALTRTTLLLSRHTT